MIVGEMVVVSSFVVDSEAIVGGNGVEVEVGEGALFGCSESSVAGNCEVGTECCDIAMQQQSQWTTPGVRLNRD